MITSILVKHGTLHSVSVVNITTKNVLLSSATTQQIIENSNGDRTDFKDLLVNVQATDDNLLLGSGLQGDTQAEVIDSRDITHKSKPPLPYTAKLFRTTSSVSTKLKMLKELFSMG